MRKLKYIFFRTLDIFLAPFVYLASLLMRFVRKGLMRMPISKKIFLHTGVFPLRNHYYEPLFDYRILKKDLRADRNLPGIDWNVNEQLSLVSKFNFQEELLEFDMNKEAEDTFFYNNGFFMSGDAEFYYNIIRHKKPKRIIEIGSGNSTLMAINAIKQNTIDDLDYYCELTCIEPYEMPWLEKLGIKVIRNKVENIEITAFKNLVAGDILFIDSSHVIRPQGDVLYEFLEILPQLNKGVIVHIHDIFSPKDYLNEFIQDHMFMWNEQYLLEAFLSHNKDFKIIGALNYLTHHHRNALAAACPVFAEQKEREPGSFWMERV